MSLVHRTSQVGADVVALECHHCGYRHGADDLEALAIDDVLRCPECGSGGMIPRTASRLGERFPGAIAARFTPLPEALLQRRVALGIGSHELLVIWSMEWHRRAMGDEVFPSHARIATHTGLSSASVKRAVSKLEDAKLIGRRRPRHAGGRLGVNRYDLDPLWNKLASIEHDDSATDDKQSTGHTDPWTDENLTRTSDEVPTMAHADPWSRGHTDHSPEVTQTPEVDVVEVNVVSEVEPDGTSPAPPALAANSYTGQWLDVRTALRRKDAA